MSKTSSPAAEEGHSGPVSLRQDIGRYFFYGWLFRDADSGSGLERASALRHNREQARWLPIYMLRWIVAGAVMLAVERLCEHLWSMPVLSAALTVALIGVVLFLLVTAVCWAFLQVGHRSR